MREIEEESLIGKTEFHKRTRIPTLKYWLGESKSH